MYFLFPLFNISIQLNFISVRVVLALQFKLILVQDNIYKFPLKFFI